MIEYMPQTEWIEGRGILVWLAFFFVELGAGTFIISSVFGSLIGMFTGWLVCALLGGGLHLLYLGHPSRSWRILTSSGWKTSWISRGLYFVSFFLVLGGIHIILARWASPSLGILVATDIFAFLTVMYGGFAMSYVSGIQFWNSGLLPVLFGVAGLWGGAGVTFVAMALSGVGPLAGLEKWTWTFLISYILLVFIYLLGATYRGGAGKYSVKELLKGRWALPFWVLVIGLGMLLPLGATAYTLIAGFTGAPLALFYASVFFELIGDLSLRYCIFRCGYYSPLLSLADS
jgi:formate-dependent nitrite reductase membrane component NrfD